MNDTNSNFEIKSGDNYRDCATWFKFYGKRFLSLLVDRWALPVLKGKLFVDKSGNFDKKKGKLFVDNCGNFYKNGNSLSMDRNFDKSGRQISDPCTAC